MTHPTICALASASGKAGVSIIRISGPKSFEVLTSLTKRPLPANRVLTVRNIYEYKDTDKERIIDEALIGLMKGPNSFTGEDVVEIHVHGGQAIVASTLEACIAAGSCRLAEPGEFTRRAYEHGRIDLTKAEAIADLIDAETRAQHIQAQRQYDGKFFETCMQWKALLLQSLASLEAAIDFPDEDDVPTGIDSRAYELISTLMESLEATLSAANLGMAVRDGFKIAIIGPPNAGKSTILNALSGREAAIVSNIPGTTRDIVEVRLVIDGYIVWVSDTAGIRETDDQIELEGVKRARLRAEESDLRIFVSSPDTESFIPDDVRSSDILVWNKTDIGKESPPENHMLISAANNDGVDQLIQSIKSALHDTLDNSLDSALISRTRHKLLISETLENCHRAKFAMENQFTADLISEDIRMAARSLGRITGEIDSEHVLDQIFSEFCIGK